MSGLMMAVVSALLGALLAVDADATGSQWGKPLGAGYEGAEVKPRPVTPAPSEFGADERATMAVFERVTKSVVFISNTAIQRDFWSFDISRFRRVQGPALFGTSRATSSPIFTSSMAPTPSR